jgi:hypothetical protein
MQQESEYHVSGWRHWNGLRVMAMIDDRRALWSWMDFVNYMAVRHPERVTRVLVAGRAYS